MKTRIWGGTLVPKCAALFIVLCVLSSAGWGAITDTVDFNSGALADSFSDNVLFGGSPYTLATNGLSGSQGVDLSNSVNAGSPTSEGTLVYKSKGFDLATLTSLEVSCFVKKQTIGAGTAGLYVGLTGSSAGHLSGVVGDALVDLRLAVVSGAWRLQFQSKAAASASVSSATSSAFTTVDGNWYRLRAIFTRIDAATIQATGVLSNASDTGAVGTTVATFGPTNYTLAGVSEIAGDHQVWAAVRGVGPGGADAFDNFQITANGVNVGIPAAPVLTATDLDSYRAALSWADNSANEDSFIVSRSLTPGGPYTDLATLAANTTAYTDKTPDRTRTNYYRVRAVSTVGSTSSNEATLAPHQSPYRWKNVAIGGGGYITGIFLHPLEANLIYLRSDVGGFFRWDAPNARWLPLLDFLTLPDKDLYGGEGLALDPHDPDVVYVACGRFAGASYGPGAIFKSTDRGTTWTKLPLTTVKMGGNEAKRSSGERLVVSPHDSNLILFGSRNDGLWRSTNAGASWTQATGFPGPGTPLYGITSIAFDPQAPGVVYAALYNDAVYRSLDDGITWSVLAGGPPQVNRLAVSSTGVLFATHQAGVSRYTAGGWSSANPSGTPLYGLSIHPANPNDVLVAEGEADVTRIYRSSDGGANWTLLNRTTQSTVPWSLSYKLGMPHVAAVEFDPFTTGRVWTTDFYGVWRTENIGAPTVQFTDIQRGIENTVALSLLAPAAGAPLLTGVADVDGFRHSAGLSTFPAQRMGVAGDRVADTCSLAVYTGDSSRVVRCVANKTSGFHVATSADGGVNWAYTTWNSNFPTVLPQRVAISATDPNNFVIGTSGDQPRVTTDGGSTWQTVTGLPNGPAGFNVFQWTQGLAADPVLANTFYYHDTAGKVYRSTNKGLSFTRVNTAATLPSQSWSTLRALPGTAGDLWLSLDTSGLRHSTDGGATFTQIATVDRAYLFAFGKPAPASTNPALYLYGRVNGSSDGIYRSLDLGATWTELTDARVAIGDAPNVMEASAQTYGQVFIGTNGRGVFTGQPLSKISVTASATPATELGPVASTFTLTRDGDLTDPLEVSFSLGGTATIGVDYTAVAPLAIIPAGAASTWITISPIPDSLAEGDETATLTLNLVGTYFLGTPASSALTLHDDPFDAWRLTHGLISAQPGDDTDHDGASDFLEYALDSDPQATTPLAYPAVTRSSGRLMLTYQRLHDPAEVSYLVQVSSDLVQWDSGPAFVQETVQPDGITVVAVDLAPVNAEKRFIRLRVTRRP